MANRISSGIALIISSVFILSGCGDSSSNGHGDYNRNPEIQEIKFYDVSAGNEISSDNLWDAYGKIAVRAVVTDPNENDTVYDVSVKAEGQSDYTILDIENGDYVLDLGYYSDSNIYVLVKADDSLGASASLEHIVFVNENDTPVIDSNNLGDFDGTKTYSAKKGNYIVLNIPNYTDNQSVTCNVYMKNLDTQEVVLAPK